MSASYGNPNLLPLVVAGADLNAAITPTAAAAGIYRFVKLSAENTVIKCPADNAAIGILQNAPKSGQKADVAIAGSLGALLYLGGSVSVGDYVKSDANGNGVLAGPGEFASAIALSAGVLNDVINVLPIESRAVPTIIVDVMLADVSAASSAFVASPVAGRVVKVVSTLQAAITGADSNLTAKVGATGMTGGTWVVANAGSAGGDVDSCTPTALNIVAKDAMLAVASDGASSTTAQLLVQFHIVPLAA